MLLLGCAGGDSAASRTASPLIEMLVLRNRAGFTTGPLQVTYADGRIDTVRVEAVEAWILDDGSEVAWSGRDGGGGYENEGQSLRIAASDSVASPRMVLREAVLIEAVEELRDSAGRRLVAIAMVDGGAGMPHLALVDPARGVVYRARYARLAARGDTLTIEHVAPEGSPLASVVEQVTIRELLGRPVHVP